MSEPAAPPAAGRRTSKSDRRSPESERRDADLTGDLNADSDETAAVPERRRYTRRAPAASPPYFEAFERIAVALEQIAQHLDQRQVRMPDTPRRSRSSAER